MNYWEECIVESFEEAGIVATKEQIDTVVGCVEGAHENYGMAFGHDCIPNPLETEVSALKRELLKKEEDHARQLWGIKKGVAQRRKVRPEDVSIDDSGNVIYYHI